MLNCQLLLPKDNILRCSQCQKYRKTLRSLVSRDKAITCRSTLNPPRLYKQKKKDTCIKDDCTVEVSDEIHASLMTFAQHHKPDDQDQDSFAHVFWLEQTKNLQSVPNGRRWHPLMIKWCIYLHHLSSSAYELLCRSDSIVLPSARTLRDYTHYFDNTYGFNNQVDIQLADTVNLDELEEHQKLVCLVGDEMKIKEGLVFNKHTNELIGFTDLGNINSSISLLEQDLHNSNGSTLQKSLASTVFVVMVRGLILKFDFPYASFPSENLTGAKIAPILLEATCRLERMGMKVLAHTLDGCPSNRKYFKLMSPKNKKGIPYKMPA